MLPLAATKQPPGATIRPRKSLSPAKVRYRGLVPFSPWAKHQEVILATIRPLLDLGRASSGISLTRANLGRKIRHRNIQDKIGRAPCSHQRRGAFILYGRT